MSNLKLKPCVVSCLGLIAGSAYAADSVTTDTVVVSAGLYEQEIIEAQNSIAVVEGEELVKTGAFTVPDAVSDVSGINVFSDGTPGIKRISIRGESSSRTLALVDGQRIDDQKNKSGVPFLVNPYFIDRIEIVKGPSSVLYGSDALGGLVNIITKQASDKMFSPEFGAVYNSSGSGFDTFVNATGTVDRFRYAFGAMYNDMGDMYLPDHERLDNTSYRNRAFNANFEYDFLDNLTAGLSYELFDSSSKTSTTVDGEYSDFRANIPEWKREKISTFIELRDLNDYVAKVKASFYYQTNDKDFNSSITTQDKFQFGGQLFDATTLVDVNTLNEQYAYGSNLQAEFTPSDMFYLVTGYDYRHEKMDSTNLSDIDVGSGSAIKINILQKVEDMGYEQDTHSLYALLSTYLTDSLTLNTGLRWNHVTSGNGSSKTTATTIVTPPGSAFTNQSQEYYGEIVNVKTVGSVGFVYNLSESSTLRLSYSQGFRTPTLQELFLNTDTGAVQRGNADLNAETSNNIEFGFRYSKEALYLDAAVFYSMAEDYIAPVYIGKENSREVYKFENIDKSNSYGLELDAELDIDNFTPYVSLTLLRRQYDVGTGSSYNTGTPTVKGRAGLKYNTGSINGFDTYVDVYSRFASRAKDDNLSRTSYTGTYTMGGWATGNISVGTNYKTSFGEYDIFASVENIFDKDYQTSELIKEPGRFFVIGLKGRY